MNVEQCHSPVPSVARAREHQKCFERDGENARTHTMNDIESDVLCKSIGRTTTATATAAVDALHERLSFHYSCGGEQISVKVALKLIKKLFHSALLFAIFLIVIMGCKSFAEHERVCACACILAENWIRDGNAFNREINEISIKYK